MDLISILMAAAGVAGTKLVEEPVKHAVRDLWSALKSVVRRRPGGAQSHDALEDIEHLRSPDQLGPELTGRIQALDLMRDPATASILRQLEVLLQGQPETKTYIFNKNTFQGTTNFN